MILIIFPKDKDVTKLTKQKLQKIEYLLSQYAKKSIRI